MKKRSRSNRSTLQAPKRKGQRRAQLSSLFRDLLSRFLIEEADLPPDRFVTITVCDVPEDLNDARIGVTILPEGDELLTLKHLRRHEARMRHFLSSKISIFKIPHLRFYLDRREQNARKMEALLDQLNEGGSEAQVH